MNSEQRPSPEQLLEAIHREENLLVGGQLKIFLGMAAGVGKTYTMLSEAQTLKQEGIHVVIGTVDTHGRTETAELLKGLYIIPKKKVFYKEKEFEELDLDAILSLKPQLVLVDELAHTNVSGLRHLKRWQDVVEILEHGINVFTTLNVQHIESLNDIVKGVTGVSVRETVPDVIVEKAAAVRLVDITPEDLLFRLKEGKVYLAGQSQIAIENFFQKDKLTALREIVLRYTAERVDQELRGMAPTSVRIFEWKPREKFLVAVSYSIHSQKLIRTTRRLASALNAPWIAVHIDTGVSLNEKEQKQLDKNLWLARDLGAEVITIHNPDVVEGITNIARHEGITQIVVGRPPKRSFLGIFKPFTLLDKLAMECMDIDIHVFRQEKFTISYRKKWFSFAFQGNSFQYIMVFLFVCFFAGVSWLVLPWIGYKIVGFIFLLSILALSLFTNSGPVLLASLLYAVIWGLLFIPPLAMFAFESSEDTILISLYVITAIVMGILVDREKKNKEFLTKSEETTRALYEIVHYITHASSTKEMIKSVKERLSKVFDGQFDILIKEPDGGINFENSTLLKEGKEKINALWVYENGKEAGWSTDILPSSQNLYIPLKSFHETVGLIIFKSSTNRVLKPDEKNFLFTVSGELASFIERISAIERTKQNEQLKQREKIHQDILQRLSDTFISPIANVKRSIAELKSKITRDDLKEIVEIENSFSIFSKLLSNIAAMSELSDGLVPIKKNFNDIKELIEDCCQNAKKASPSHQFQIDIEKGIPRISFDYNLIEILFYNLLFNAIEYSPPASTIHVKAEKVNDFFCLSVADEGKGIPEDQLNVIFEKFYRLPEETTPGVGLGLAVAKTIAEIHKGYLKVENLPEKGSKFSLYLPLK